MTSDEYNYGNDTPPTSINYYPCVHCCRTTGDHARGGKCLFEATYYREMTGTEYEAWLLRGMRLKSVQFMPSRVRA